VSDTVREATAEVRISLDRSGPARKLKGPSGGQRTVYGLRIQYARGNWRNSAGEQVDRADVVAECQYDAFAVVNDFPQWLTDLVEQYRPAALLDSVPKLEGQG
jgi:hypothetical protein